MIINHNISALNIQKEMNMRQDKMSKSMERLSSGLRINHAADEAAGLAISEGMRAQIRGLEQAAKNSNDAISYIQTAEGALQETHNILHRMRELAVQAANDTNTSEDREKIQNEMNQLTKEINHIGTNTQYNTQSMLKGTPAKIDGTVDYGTTTLENLNIDMDSVLDTGRYEILVEERKLIQPAFHGDSRVQEIKLDQVTDLATGNYNVVVDFDANATVTANPTTITSITYNGKNEDLIRSGYEIKVKHSLNLVNTDGLITYKDTYKVQVVNNSANYQSGEIEVFPAKDSEGVIIDPIKFIFNPGKKIGDFTISGTLYKDTMNPETFDLSGDGWRAQVQNSIGPNYNQLKTSAGNLVQSDWVNIQPPGGNPIDIPLVHDINNSNSTNDIKVTFTNYFNEGKTSFAIVQESTASLFDSVGTELESEIIKSGDQSVVLKKNFSWLSFDVRGGSDVTDGSVFFDVYNPDDYYTKMQTGANADEILTVAITDMRANNLGITSYYSGERMTEGGHKAYYTNTAEIEFREDLNWSEFGLDVSTQEKASTNIAVIDEAISKVSANRSNMGTYQNRLGYTINNLNNQADNLTATESRIRDVNMAKEIMEFTKNNVISQAAQAILVQANQKPQGILQLLK